MSNPISVIINPPGIQSGMPGDVVSLYVVIINEGDQSAVIDLFFSFDETFQKISGWSNSPKASLAVASQESSDEVTFNFDIPVDALPGTYDYTFVVDSPEHYPQDTPINFPGQLKVLLREQTVIRASDPTFSIIPATNPNKPIIYRLDTALQVIIKVENRSNRVDRFRLTCPDLEANWYKITYPASGLESVGLFEVNAIELNPNTEGEINVEFTPPTNTLAGSYSPTIRLASENNPDLVLLDLVYILIPDNYKLGVELNTILGRVSHKKGAYELVLNNQGNLVRELYFSAKGRDEEELCTYEFETRELKLLPGKTEKVNLAVKPRPWWRQPLLGEPLLINFQVDVTDKQGYDLANASPQASLSWKARPWWQFLLLLLLGLGLFAGASYLIWRALNPDPLTIDNFSIENSQLIEGDEVELNFAVSNYKRKKDLQVTVKPSVNNEAILNNEKLNQLINRGQNNSNLPCRITPQEELICQRVPTGVTAKGKYVFELKVASAPSGSPFNRRTQPDIQKTAEVEIGQRPTAEIVEFKVGQQRYKKGEKVSLNWKMLRPELAKDVIIDTLGAGNVKVNSRLFTFKNGTIADSKYKNACKPDAEDKQRLSCKIDDFTADQVGTFSYQITVGTIDVRDRSTPKQADSPIEVLPKPFQIVFFRINNRDQLTNQPTNIEVNEGEKITVSWKVEGENILVNLDPYGNVKQSDTLQFPVIINFPPQTARVALQVIDKSGKQQALERPFIITIKPKPTPAPVPINTIKPNVPVPSPTLRFP
ncbi:hypothetical protein NIES4071_85430 [Calothrix sp. NIES-4071]|nr:hypothetical protein NIES4071_85430 [Calothrix sp. NIES-4071]BAZ62810.1 hypothetical protein NIES4105_85360 [Calothrix sp. NIES-4105]